MPGDIDVAMDLVTDGDAFLVLKKAASYRESVDRYRRNPWEIPGGKIAHELDAEETEDAALRELHEETGLSGEVVATGDPYSREQGGRTITFHPVRIRVDSRAVSLSPEHETAEWIDPETFSARMTEHEQDALSRVSGDAP